MARFLGGVGACVVLPKRRRDLHSWLEPLELAAHANDLQLARPSNSLALLADEIDEEDIDNSNGVELAGLRSPPCATSKPRRVPALGLCSPSPTHASISAFPADDRPELNGGEQQCTDGVTSPSSMGSLPCTPRGEEANVTKPRVKHFRMSIGGDETAMLDVRDSGKDWGSQQYQLSMPSFGNQPDPSNLPQAVPDERQGEDLEDMYDFDPVTVANLNAVADLTNVLDRMQAVMSPKANDGEQERDPDFGDAAVLETGVTEHNASESISDYVAIPHKQIVEADVRSPTHHIAAYGSA